MIAIKVGKEDLPPTAIIIFFDDNSIISLLLFVIETVLGPIILPQPVIKFTARIFN